MAFPTTLKYTSQAVTSLAVGKVDSSSPTISGIQPPYFASWGSDSYSWVTKTPACASCHSQSPVYRHGPFFLHQNQTAATGTLGSLWNPCTGHRGTQRYHCPFNDGRQVSGWNWVSDSLHLTKVENRVLYIWHPKDSNISESQNQTIFSPRDKIIVWFGQNLSKLSLPRS